MLTAVQYEDVVSELSQANVPGSTEGYPNWRRKLDRTLESIAAPGGPLAKLAASLAAEDRGPRSGAARLASAPPRSTYRLQFHKDFTFADAEKIVPLSRQARHQPRLRVADPEGPARLDARLRHRRPFHDQPGARRRGGLRPLLGRLHGAGLKLLLDIVPNHMGVGGADNPWWLSVLEWGGLSPSAEAFDIDWSRLGAKNKLVVPFLGDRYGEALEKGTLELKFDPEKGAFSIWHYEHEFPICPLQYPTILNRSLAAGGHRGRGRAGGAGYLERLRLMGEDTSDERRRVSLQRRRS